MDILDCCSTSDFYSLLCFDRDVDGFQISIEYRLTDVNVLQALPSIGLTISPIQKQLNKISRYIRNNVRWTNLFHPLQDLWTLKDATEINRNIHTASSLLRQWKLQRNSSRISLKSTNAEMPQYVYKRVISRCKNCFGLVVSANLQCPTSDDMPLKLQNYLDAYKLQPLDYAIPKSLNQLETKFKRKFSTKPTENYEFHLELKIQHPSFLSEKVQEAILRVDQLGEETILSSNGDEILRAATFRAEEGSSEE
ncbi:UNVERIFIED_CONTAM: hypothetical protein PYX00_005491 [Menopon gallinae]|uniref:Uncharacterized protein n=1 Tax=Menopon gallinae TaxID=328185 RepID=A0AAW2HSD2_9NEOP